MTPDCNNCNHHLQGRTINDCPSICWSCFDHTVTPMKLRNWTPKEASPGLMDGMTAKVVHRGLGTMTVRLTPNNKQVGGDHYKDMDIEPWDVVDTWPMEQRIGFYRGCILKYNMRMGSKDARLQEAEKCLHVQEKLVEVLKEEAPLEALQDKGSAG